MKLGNENTGISLFGIQRPNTFQPAHTYSVGEKDDFNKRPFVTCFLIRELITHKNKSTSKV